MGVRCAGVVVAVASSACSFAMHPGPKPSASMQASCERKAPLVDTVTGAALTGVGTGALVLATRGDTEARTQTALVGASLALAGIVYFASARHGFAQQSACYRAELVATRATPAPLHPPIERVAHTCEQRRLDMYSRAVTGADPQQRARLLAELPVCGESPTRERAWQLTKQAALAAGAGECDDIESIAQEVYLLDVGLHDVVLLGDIEIKWCLQRREL